MAYIEIGGPLHSIASGNIAVYTNEAFDKTLNKKQNVINLEVSERLLQAVTRIEYDSINDALVFKNYEGDIIYTLQLDRSGGLVKNIIESGGKVIIKYFNDIPDLVLDVFIKDDYYTKAQIDNLQENVWPIEEEVLDELLDELDLNPDNEQL